MFYQQKQLLACLTVNIILTVSMVSIVIVFASDSSSYFRYGPSPDLYVVSVQINTWIRWVILVALICLSKILDLVINDVAWPIFNFSIFNPDKKQIKGYTQTSLQIQANLMYMMNSIRNVFEFVVQVTQIDLAIAGVIVQELASIVTFRYLLSKKQFLPNVDPESLTSEEYTEEYIDDKSFILSKVDDLTPFHLKLQKDGEDFF